MIRCLYYASICVLALTLPAVTQADESVLPQFGEEITIIDAAPFLYPVALGQPVLIRFGIGEIDISTSDHSEVRADLEVSCSSKLSEALCDKYRRRLRLEPHEDENGVEVRLVGLSKWKLRKLRLRGHVEVPRWSPLEVRIGIGVVEIHSDAKNLSVKMGIGDLTIRVPEDKVASVEMGTRIGDASVRGIAGYVEGRRRMLVGARVAWHEGTGPSRIDVGLKIGDASVVLE